MLNGVGLSGEDLLFGRSMKDLTQAADLLRPFFDTSRGVDGTTNTATPAELRMCHARHSFSDCGGTNRPVTRWPSVRGTGHAASLGGGP